MKLFKKIVFPLVLMLAVVFSVGAFAEEAVMCDTVKVYFSAVSIPTAVENNVVFNLFDESGENLLAAASHQIKRGEPGFEVEFPVSQYAAGTKFKFVVESGAEGALHNGETAKEHILSTYAMPDENGVLHGYTSFYMSLNPYWNKEAVIKVPGTDKTLFYHCLTDDEVYVTVDLLAMLDIKIEKHYEEEKPYFVLYTDDTHMATFYLNESYAVIGEETVMLSLPTFEIDSMPYVPLSKVGIYFACNYIPGADSEYTREISITPSVYSERYAKAALMNSRGISSKTNYMIWVSKKDFTVNIFTGSKNNWKLLTTFPCSIGKPSSPTVEGQFEYHQYQPRWTYPKYYCGPIMRFYRGYAFHSYLIKYDGTPYDARLGMKVSAGCVRMHPNDITWMTKNIPMYTKVYVTP